MSYESMISSKVQQLVKVYGSSISHLLWSNRTSLRLLITAMLCVLRIRVPTTYMNVGI
jgi:hypothetical protein